tara:strand:- start:4095 stop:4685 length:591 start_codon:yes stop_codon:yes gene_type:complete
MNVNVKAATKLFVDLGFPTASKWSAARLEKKIEGLPDIIDEDTEAGDSEDLLEKILAALDDDEGVKVVDSVPTEKEEEEVEVKFILGPGEGDKPPKKKKKKKEEPKEEPKEESKPLPEKKPIRKGGVIATIVEILEAASEKKPITKEDILGKLIKKFPGKEPASMMSTIKTQVPSRLKLAKGIIVEKNNEGGWWIN